MYAIRSYYALDVAADYSDVFCQFKLVFEMVSVLTR